MCRLFGLHAGATPVAATFWLLDAPDSLAAQSQRNPDGTGIGVFDAEDDPVVDKEPMAAWRDDAFASAARELTSRTFVAHVRYASTGGLSTLNTHPFAQDGRLLAHNGVVEGLERLDARIGQLGTTGLVMGQSDSERVFALITGETRAHDGCLEDGLSAAVSWIGAQLPVFALNLVLTTPTELWALRYPQTHELWVLEHSVAEDGAGGSTPASPGSGHGPKQLDVHSGRIRSTAPGLAGSPAVIVATERMDGDPGWRAMAAGELLRVGPDLVCHTSTPFAPPVHALSHADLGGRAAASQAA